MQNMLVLMSIVLLNNITFVNKLIVKIRVITNQV